MYGVLRISAPPVAEAAADRDEVVAESSPPNVWYGNTLNVAIPLEFELIEPAKRRVVSSKCGRTAFYTRRESVNSFVHNGLSGSSDHAWACGSRGGKPDKRERVEARDPTVHLAVVVVEIDD